MGTILGVALPDDFFSDDDTGYDALSTLALGADLSAELEP